MPEVEEPACSPTPPTRPAAGAAGAPADPGGNQIPGGPPIHVFPPGPTDVTLPFSGGTLQGLDVGASVITDYRDVTALAYHAGTATGSKRYNLSPAGVAGGGCQLTADVRKGYRVLGGAWAGPDPARPCSSAVAGGDGTRRDLVFRSRARSSRQHLLTAAGEQPVRLAIGATAAARPGPRGLHPRHGRQKAMVLRRGRQAARSAGSWTRSGPGTGRATRERTCRRRASRPCLPDRPTDSQRLAILAHSC